MPSSNIFVPWMFSRLQEINLRNGRWFHHAPTHGLPLAASAFHEPVPSDNDNTAQAVRTGAKA
jgi:hypothetical protein